MSAFVCILERSGEVVNRESLRRIAAPLEDHGRNLTTFCRGPVGIALIHNRGSEARSEQGPLEDPNSGRVVASSGRFTPVTDKNSFPSSQVPRPYQPAAHASLVLSRHANREHASTETSRFLASVAGSFVLIVADPRNRSIEIARDHLGSSKVYYSLTRDRLIAASEPSAILRHSDVSAEPDPGSVARFLGFRFDLRKESFFQGIRELPPAHLLKVTSTEAGSEQYWQFPAATDEAADPREVTDTFRRQLARAVRDDLAGLEPEQVALSLSGGLDSTAIAALAPAGIRAFSWTFDKTPAGDERRRIEQVSKHLDLPVRWVAGDGLHPFGDDFVEQFVHPNSPYINPFSALKHRLYEAAKQEGCRRILVGDGGDAHYAAAEYWLRDALAFRESGALKGLAGVCQRALSGDSFARRSLRRLLPFARRPRVLRPPLEPWLTTAARTMLGERRWSPILPFGGSPERYELCVGIKQSELESEEQRLFACSGIERANPFWSWPLLEQTLHLPAFWYYRNGRSKVLTREALRGLLPQEVLQAPRTGLLGDFFLAGLKLRRGDLQEMIFQHPRSDWPRYVQRDWLEPFLSDAGAIAFGHTILWRVICYELWIRRLLEPAQNSLTPPDLESKLEQTRFDRDADDTTRDTLQGDVARSESEKLAQTSESQELQGQVFGVALRGNLPAHFGPYLRPLTPDCLQAVDNLTVHYKSIDKLPDVDPIWASDAETAEACDGGKFLLFEQPDGFGLAVSGLGEGVFRCSRQSIEIEWTAKGTAAPHFFFTYALPLWLEYRGIPVLHGSVVSIGDQAVGFVGPSGIGKSFLAAQLVQQGCALLSDDAIVLQPDRTGTWRSFEGPPLQRLWPSALHLLDIESQHLPRVHETLDKRQLRIPGETALPGRGTDPASSSETRLGSLPLGALYILEGRTHPETPVEISPLPSAKALFSLIEHSVAASPAAALGLSARRFQVLADFVEKVPVRRLQLPGGPGHAGRIKEKILKDLADRTTVNQSSSASAPLA